MLTEKEVTSFNDPGTSEVHIIDNPASPETDPTLALIAKRCEQFKKSRLMNPNGVVIGDFDVASAWSEDPKNPVDDDHPSYFYIFRHKKTGKMAKVQNSAAHGWIVPFNVVFDLSVLAEK